MPPLDHDASAPASVLAGTEGREKENAGDEGKNTGNPVVPQGVDQPSCQPQFDIFDGVPPYGEVAQQLVNGGYFPVPIKPGTKGPVGLTGWASAGEEAVPGWAHSYPNWGIGIRSGAGLLVIDIDTTNPELSAQLVGVMNGGVLPEAPLRIGKKGGALLYRCQDAGQKEEWELEGDPSQVVELRGAGHQLAVYAIHPDTSLPYRWIGGHPLTTPLDGLAKVELDDVRQALAAFGFRLKNSAVKHPGGVSEPMGPGGRHNGLLRYGAQLVAQNCTDALHDVLQKRNLELCNPPLPAGEVDEIASWCLNRDRNINTELDAAEDFATLFGGDHRHGRGVWWCWHSGRYTQDKEGATERAAKTYVRVLEQKVRNVVDVKLRSALLSRARSFQTAGKIGAILQLAKTETSCVIHPDHFDRDPMVLNVANGVVNLKTGVLHEASRADMLTKQAPVVFDPSAECPKFMAFLAETFNGDAEVIAYLQRVFGYALTGRTVEQALFIFWGRGQNGKSTLLEVLKAMLGEGEYALTAAPSVLLERKGDNIPNDLADLAGARFVTASETERNQRFAATRIKQLTGDETLKARFMRGEFFSFVPVLKLFLATNGLPKFDGADFAMVRRLHVIKFNNIVPEHRVNPLLKEELLSELSGILNWCLAGCLEWQRARLRPPASVIKAREEYAAKMDTTGQYLAEKWVVTNDRKDKVKFTELWTNYWSWAVENGLSGSKITKDQLIEDMEKHGVVFHKKTCGYPHFLNIRPPTSEEIEKAKREGAEGEE